MATVFATAASERLHHTSQILVGSEIVGRIPEHGRMRHLDLVIVMVLIGGILETGTSSDVLQRLHS